MFGFLSRASENVLVCRDSDGVVGGRHGLVSRGRWRQRPMAGCPGPTSSGRDPFVGFRPSSVLSLSGRPRAACPRLPRSVPAGLRASPSQRQRAAGVSFALFNLLSPWLVHFSRWRDFAGGRGGGRAYSAERVLGLLWALGGGGPHRLRALGPPHPSASLGARTPWCAPWQRRPSARCRPFCSVGPSGQREQEPSARPSPCRVPSARD